MSEPQPCSFIIIGATGNLVQEKLLPALYALERGKRLHAALRFIACGRRPLSLAEWQEMMATALQRRLGDSLDRECLERLVQRFDYVGGDLHDGATFAALKEVLAQPPHTDAGECASLVFYLAIPPMDFSEVVTQLDRAGFAGGHLRHRVVVEKPFGEDLESARRLNAHLHAHFSEEQIFRIDHYLGKETVQNLLVFRFANSLIEPIWNRHYIDHVQITVAESVGIGSRAGYYDQAGALRDMLQNHLMQLLSLVAMEPPASLEADALRDEKVKVLRSIRPVSRRAVNSMAFRAQYAAGRVDGEEVRGYQQEEGVEPNSTTETYVAAKFYVDNWRWSGVPFYLRTGKRMAQPMSLIGIRFRHPPRQLFRETAIADIEPNWVVFALQPNESMQLELHTKQPGLGMSTRKSRLVASYRAEHEEGSEAYETLLLDVIEGDRSLFIRFDEVELAWRVVDPILRHWAGETDFIHAYPAGSWGPGEASRLFDSEEHEWRNTV
jgi:glucose-6-phosphate 1-dehydrogenase